MGLLNFIGRLISADARYNHELYKSGKADKSRVVYTTIGWRPDPIYNQDGFKKVEGEAASGEDEYEREA
jgi:hypothetical protein